MVEQAINQLAQVTPLEQINEKIHEITDLVRGHVQEFLSIYGVTLNDVKVLIRPRDDRMRGGPGWNRQRPRWCRRAGVPHAVGLDELLQFDWTLVGEADALAVDLADSGALGQVDLAATEERLARLRGAIADCRRYVEILA